jgi:hypothetical protein
LVADGIGRERRGEEQEVGQRRHRLQAHALQRGVHPLALAGHVGQGALQMGVIRQRRNGRHLGATVEVERRAQPVDQVGQHRIAD